MSEIILTSEQIEHKLERIAYQILEANGENQTIIIAGIVANGYAVAERIVHHLKANSLDLGWCARASATEGKNP